MVLKSESCGFESWHCCRTFNTYIEAQTGQCSMCSNPANGRVDIEEVLAYKIQLNGLADCDERSTKSTDLQTYQHVFVLKIPNFRIEKKWKQVKTKSLKCRALIRLISTCYEWRHKASKYSDKFFFNIIFPKIFFFKIFFFPKIFFSKHEGK